MTAWMSWTIERASELNNRERNSAGLCWPFYVLATAVFAALLYMIIAAWIRFGHGRPFLVKVFAVFAMTVWGVVWGIVRARRAR
jgi:hypothetical protein